MVNGQGGVISKWNAEASCEQGDEHNDCGRWKNGPNNEADQCENSTATFVPFRAPHPQESKQESQRQKPQSKRVSAPFLNAPHHPNDKASSHQAQRGEEHCQCVTSNRRNRCFVQDEGLRFSRRKSSVHRESERDVQRQKRHALFYVWSLEFHPLFTSRGCTSNTPEDQSTQRRLAKGSGPRRFLSVAFGCFSLVRPTPPGLPLVNASIQRLLCQSSNKQEQEEHGEFHGNSTMDEKEPTEVSSFQISQTELRQTAAKSTPINKMTTSGTANPRTKPATAKSTASQATVFGALHADGTENDAQQPKPRHKPAQNACDKADNRRPIKAAAVRRVRHQWIRTAEQALLSGWTGHHGESFSVQLCGGHGWSR